MWQSIQTRQLATSTYWQLARKGRQEKRSLLFPETKCGLRPTRVITGFCLYTVHTYYTIICWVHPYHFSYIGLQFLQGRDRVQKVQSQCAAVSLSASWIIPQKHTLSQPHFFYLSSLPSPNPKWAPWMWGKKKQIVLRHGSVRLFLTIRPNYTTILLYELYDTSRICVN